MMVHTPGKLFTQLASEKGKLSEKEIVHLSKHHFFQGHLPFLP